MTCWSSNRGWRTPTRRSVEIRGALGDIGYPVDVVVIGTDRFERTKRVIGGIAYPANKYGRVIYAAA